MRRRSTPCNAAFKSFGVANSRYGISSRCTRVSYRIGESLYLLYAPLTIPLRVGFDHGAGHPLLFLDDAKAPNYRKNNGFKDLGNYSEWPKVAGAVFKAQNLNFWHGERVVC